MKLTASILLMACLTASAAGNSQKITISEKNANIEKVFKVVENQTDYVFFYDYSLINQARKVTIQAKDISLGDLLEICFKNQPLTYTIVDKTIVVKMKMQSTSEDLVVITEAVPTIDISGFITDENDNPLKGASVLVKGTNKGTSTDEKGFFSLKDVSDNPVLVISYVGFVSREMAVSKGGSISIQLKQASSTLGETVVVGYGSVKRKDLTGSVSSINMNELKNVPFVSIDQAITGKAPGVLVTQADGSPGGVARVRIRGGASLIGGNDPLYIIDGVQMTIQNNYIQSAADVVNPTERLGKDGQYMSSTIGSSFAKGLNTLAGLNINDIESVDILKDASATAIYGSRAANGVVIITTKKGKKNQKPVLEANYYMGRSTAITEKLLNADQYKAVMLEGAKNLNALRLAQNKPADATATAIINNINFLGTANTNWLDLVTRTGVTHNVDLSVRGGGTGSRYYTSLAYTNQSGTLLGTDFSRLAGKINLDNEITNKLRVITNLDYGFTRNNITNGIYSTALYVPPTLAPFNADGSPNVFDPVSFGAAAYQGIQNPMALLQGINRSRSLLLLGSMAVEYDILKSLKFKSVASVNYSNNHQLNYVPSSVSIASPSGASSSNGGVGTQAQSFQTNAFYENTLTWDKQFNKSNRLNLLLGTSWQQTNMRSFSASGQGFPDDKFLNGLSSAALAMPPKASDSKSSLLSFYMRANYAFKEKYLLTFTGRSDESSKFPKNNRIGYFPSFGAAWKISEENFLKNVSWINELKFRVSAGYSGTQNLGDNLFYTLYTPGAYASTNALIPSQLGNERIKWETTLQKDLGLDFAFFNARFRGAIGYYNKRSSDLLVAVPVPSSSGFTSALVNLADISNKGLEIDLRADVIRKKDLGWNVAVNISKNRSKVTKIKNDLQNPTQVGYTDPFYRQQFSLGNSILREGQPIGLIYGYTYTGVIKTQKQLDDYKLASLYAQYGILPNLALGHPMYKTIDSGLYKGYWERNVIGHAEPKLYGGLTNTFNYKQFSLIATFNYSFGGELLYMPDVNAFGLGDRSNRNTRILLDHYSASNPNADRPSLILKETNTYGTGASSYDVHDASYVKLKSLSVNYELPQKLISKWHMRSAMVYVSGSNLFMITKYPGPDPEISNDPYSLISGYTDAATYPTMRQFTFGVRLGF